MIAVRRRLPITVLLFALALLPVAMAPITAALAQGPSPHAGTRTARRSGQNHRVQR